APEQACGAAGRGRQPEQHADGGGLAGAVGPEKSVHAAGGHAQIEVVDGELVAEAFGQAMGFDGRFAHGTACRRSTGTAPRKTCPCGVISTLNRSVLTARPPSTAVVSWFTSGVSDRSTAPGAEARTVSHPVPNTCFPFVAAGGVWCPCGGVICSTSAPAGGEKLNRSSSGADMVRSV